MKRAVLGALAGAGLMMAALGAWDQRDEVFAQRADTYPPSRMGSALIALPGPVSEDGQLLMVVDSRQPSIAVYHVNKTTGKIALRSIRNINWDLQMTYFDNDGLLPQEIRALLEQR